MGGADQRAQLVVRDLVLHRHQHSAVLGVEAGGLQGRLGAVGARQRLRVHLLGQARAVQQQYGQAQHDAGAGQRARHAQRAGEMAPHERAGRQPAEMAVWYSASERALTQSGTSICTVVL